MLDDLCQWARSMSGEVGLSSGVPCWLDTLFKEEFFDPCSIHPALKQNDKNVFCLDCSKSFCNNCSSSHYGHRVLQIRKYNDHRVVKAEDMERLLNCSLVQSYMLNRAQVVFLKTRSPNRKKEKAEAQELPNKKRARALKHHFQSCEKTCSSCTRSLKEEYNYCSITCMVKQVLRTDGSIVGHLRRFPPLPSNLEEPDGELVPRELVLRDPNTSGSMMNGTRRVDFFRKMKENSEEASPSTPVKLHRRKSVPRRAPLC